ncbi:serine hydrolase domain-containing protein [Sphingomonas mollis]|uniref:Beta-lactamase family protein n=1 Tax=Sphingomonas mollis TaxID=2795726 RepID=A0ABS0XSN7_9SPHN|nr:serine hydrolase domain-containing protein [Sphingomonas sp. BT553]MBJ6123058.1 beta-lactamase family protein [Sphingomonas sp. BT553]
MKRLLAALMLLAAPAVAQTGAAGDVARADAAAKARIDAAVPASGFVGVYTVYQGPRRITGGSVGVAAVGQPGGFAAESVWPWASVTKQVVATMVMQEVDKGHLSLDVPAGRYLPALGASAPTLRQLLRHRAGLRNPDDSVKDANGQPGFYTTGETGLGWCLRGRGAVGGQWRYNNCDYIVLGAILERTTRTALPALFAQRIAAPLGLTAHFATAAPADVDEAWNGGPDAAERATLVRYGAAGGLVGTAGDMATFDRALLSGSLLSRSALATMWAGDPALGHMALGQWAFTTPLSGCAAPVRIVERRGAIGRFQVRNLILPDQGLTIVLLTNRGDFDFGEIWQGKGPSHAILSSATCA